MEMFNKGGNDICVLLDNVANFVELILDQPEQKDESYDGKGCIRYEIQNSFKIHWKPSFLIWWTELTEQLN